MSVEVVLLSLTKAGRVAIATVALLASGLVEAGPDGIRVRRSQPLVRA